MIDPKLSNNNYFSLLSIPLLGKILAKTGELSKMALVSHSFNEAANDQAFRILRRLSPCFWALFCSNAC